MTQSSTEHKSDQTPEPSEYFAQRPEIKWESRAVLPDVREETSTYTARKGRSR